LQDLSTREVEENIKFYHMLSSSSGHDTKQKNTNAPLPPALVKDLFPEIETKSDSTPPIMSPPVIKAGPITSLIKPPAANDAKTISKDIAAKSVSTPQKAADSKLPAVPALKVPAITDPFPASTDNKDKPKEF